MQVLDHKLKCSSVRDNDKIPPFSKGDTGGFGFWPLMFVVILCVLFYAEPVCADARGSDVVGKLQKKFSGLKTLAAKFSKQHYWPLMDQRQEVKGKLLVQRPNRFRFDSDVQVVVTDGNTAWNYAPANAQVMVSDYATVEKDRNYEKLLFDLILLGEYDETYEPVYVGEEKISRKTCHMVDLSAKKEDTYVHTIRLWIDKRLNLVRQVEYRNIHDEVTTFVLTDLKVDKKVDAKQFTFEAPNGVEVIDLR